jgi:hypothetical protein
LREEAVVLGAQEVGQEAVLGDLHLVEIEGAEFLYAVVADITGLYDGAFDLLLDADAILLHVGSLEIRVDQANSAEGIGGMVACVADGNLELGDRERLGLLANDREMTMALLLARPEFVKLALLSTERMASSLT